MRDAIVKYGLFYGALFFVGIPAWFLTHMALDPIGGHGSSLLNSGNVTGSVLLGLGAVVIALAVGLLAGKLLSAKGGLLNMGVILAWGASGLGTVRTIVMANTNPETGAGTRTTLSHLAIEAVIVGALVVGATWLIERHARKGDDAPADDPKPGAWITTLLCGFAGSAVGVWLIAQSGYKGQVVGSALVGGLLGGLIAHAVDQHARLWPIVAGCVLLSVAGPVVALVTGGSDANLHAAAIGGTISRWAQLTGLDGVAGACLGVPVGLYIGKGLLGHAGKVAEDVG